MVGTPASSVHRKRQSVFGRLKTALRGRSNDQEPLPPSKPSTSEPTASLDAKSGPVDLRVHDLKSDNHDAKDYWQIAYGKLSESDQNTLATLRPATATELQYSGRSPTKEILDQVIKTTEMHYRENQRKDDIRATALKTLNSALSFQDVVDNALKFDPTGYASSAWAIVSLGLTMAKNHADLHGALFDSSGYLADLLARCAFIEEEFYRGRGLAVPSAENERSIVRVYMAILQYSAKVRRVQQFGKGKDILESITAATSKQLAQLKAVINEEESHLHRWLALDQHLRRQAEAESILTRIDQMMVGIQKVHEAVAMLDLPSANSALFDSFIDQHEDECLQGTRTDLLQQVKDWGSSSDRCIFWLSGMAGTGKSTIARTVARSFKEDGILGASFFFKRGERDRGSAAKFFPTIVKQLAVHIPQMTPGIQKAIEDDPAILGGSLREQFDKLMLQPLRSVDQGQVVTSTMIVIDALDECEQEKDVEVILELLPMVKEATGIAIRFFVTSRPESPVRFGFDQIGQSNYQNTILQNLDDDVIKKDITLYLTEEFSKIRQKHQHVLPLGWPGEERIKALAEMAAPLFIFAATACRFVADKKWSPERRLEQFLSVSSGSKMDKTYRPVLEQLHAEDESEMDMLVEEFQKTIGVIILLAAPLSLSALAELVEIPEGDISVRLDAFHSVLTIPSDANLPIRTLHLSFHDYLLAESTKAQKSTSRFWVNKQETHGLIIKQCFTVMDCCLRKNICKLPSYGTSRTEIDPASIARFLPPALQYACRYWVHHLTQISAPARSLDQVLHFLNKHLLHWLESMAILGIISEALSAVNTLLQLTEDIANNEISTFLFDARRFILRFMSIIDTAPLQIYRSGLVFAPQKSLIRINFERELPDWLSRGPRVEENWSADLQTLEGHSSSVWSVAFSPDSQLLASGSYDRTIKLWDPATGALKHTLKDHSGIVGPVAFSPDGQLLASGSQDETIKLWDPNTGALKHTLEGHSAGVWSVAFSPDGQLLASGSNDESLASSSVDPTIKIWDPATGALKHTLEGHWGMVWSIAFSPDSQLLASSSNSGTIMLWDPATGTLDHTFESDSGSVRSVAFSPNSQLLASGSNEQTIELWDLATRTLKHTLEGHSGTVGSVAFSKDGRLLASSSADRTIKIWDPATGTLKHTLNGHSDYIRSVAFSPDGQLLASGSADQTIKLWDLATSTLRHALEDHSGPVWSVASSLDGQMLASGSADRTVKLWDLATGALKHTLEGHSFRVEVVAFSPDGQLLASSSDHETRLWDPATGALKHSLQGKSGSYGSVAFSPGGNLLVSGSICDTLSCTINIWDPATGALMHTLEVPSSLFKSGAFSPDGQLLACGFHDGTIKLWDLDTGALEHTLEATFDSFSAVSLSEGHAGSIELLAFSPDGQLLASSSADHTIKLWDPATGALKHTLKGHSGTVGPVAFSKDGQLLASSAADRSIKLWDPATGTLKHTINTNNFVENIKFSDNLPQLMTNLGSYDIQAFHKSYSSVSSNMKTKISLQEGRWITVQGQRELWLPPDYEPESLVIQDGAIALGCRNGRVRIFTFSA